MVLDFQEMENYTPRFLLPFHESKQRSLVESRKSITGAAFCVKFLWALPGGTGA